MVGMPVASSAKSFTAAAERRCESTRFQLSVAGFRH